MWKCALLLSRAAFCLLAGAGGFSLSAPAGAQARSFSFGIGGVVGHHGSFHGGAFFGFHVGSAPWHYHHGGFYRPYASYWSWGYPVAYPYSFFAPVYTSYPWVSYYSPVYAPRPDYYADRGASIERDPYRSREIPRRERATDDDYYLYRPRAVQAPERGLARAVSEIQAAYLTGDAALLGQHVDPAATVAVLAAGKKRSDILGSAYLERTREAFRSMKTVRFSLDRIEPAGNGDWRASGVHVITEADRDKSYDVAFVLRKQGDEWVVREVDASRRGTAEP